MKPGIRGRFGALRDYDIEAYLCGELPAHVHAQVEDAAQRDPELASYLAERRAAQRAFASLHPWSAPARAPLRLRRDGAVLWGAALAAALLVGIVAPRLGREPPPPLAQQRSGASIRVKGGALQAEVFVKRDDAVFRYRGEQGLRENDQLRIAVECPAPGYLSVFGRDARGQIAIYYDRLQTDAGRFTVPDSLVLDDAPGDEQWFIVHGSEPLPASHYAAQVAAGEAVSAPHTIVRLHKGAP